MTSKAPESLRTSLTREVRRTRTWALSLLAVDVVLLLLIVLHRAQQTYLFEGP